MVNSPATVVFIARDEKRGGEIVGSLTLALFRIPTGLRAWIEDVVVDAAARGQGIGEALTRAALTRAEQAYRSTEQAFLAEWDRTRPQKRPRHLGLDEIQRGKGQQFWSVLSVLQDIRQGVREARERARS